MLMNGTVSGTSCFFGLAVTCREYQFCTLGLSITCLRVYRILAVFLPLNHYASKIVVRAQDSLMKSRDERVSLMNEVSLNVCLYLAYCVTADTFIFLSRSSALFGCSRCVLHTAYCRCPEFNYLLTTVCQ